MHVLCGGPLLRANCSAMVTELIRSGKVHTLTQNMLWKLSVNETALTIVKKSLQNKEVNGPPTS